MKMEGVEPVMSMDGVEEAIEGGTDTAKRMCRNKG